MGSIIYLCPFFMMINLIMIIILRGGLRLGDPEMRGYSRDPGFGNPKDLEDQEDLGRSTWTLLGLLEHP